MNQTTRISPSMTGQEAIMAIIDGNPGAISACMGMMEASARIDPDYALGDFGPIFMLDELGIYGPRIWMLYKDVCGHDPVYAVALLRAVQLGILKRGALNDAIDGKATIDPAEILGKVKERLPRFAK